MKGISNLLAAAIMISVAVAVSLTVSNFVLTTAKNASQTISNQTEEKFSCVHANFYIKNATFDSGGDCTRGVTHSLILTVKNTGQVKMKIDNVVVETVDGRTFNFAIDQDISTGETKTLNSYNEEACTGMLRQSSSGYTNRIKSIIMGSSTCPSTDSLTKDFIELENANQTESMPGKYTVSIWHFNSSLSDSSGNENDGAFYGGSPTYQTGACAGFGDSVQFDGIDDYVEVSDSQELNITEELTIEGWIYVN